MFRLTECIDVWPLVSVKPVKQRFCLANVGNLKALRECSVRRFKDLPCLGLSVLPDPETRKAQRVSQLPEERALLLCQLQGLSEALFRRRGRLMLRILQHQFALD